MSLLVKFNSKLSYKLHIPILVVVIIGLLIVTANATLAIKKLTHDKHYEVQQTYQNYGKKALQAHSALVLTNVISIANNQEIQQALYNNNRNLARTTLNTLIRQYHQYTDFKDIKIHIHTKDLHSFIRSWRPNKFGDDLSSFRHSLRTIQQTQLPFVTVEMGRAGLLLRGISPVFYKDNFIGSIEFIQSFDSILTELKQNHNLDAMILTSEDQTIKYFNKLTPVGTNRVLLNGNNQNNIELIHALKNFDFDSPEIQEHITRGNYFITGIPLYSYSGKRVGCFLLADSLENVNAIVDNARQSLLYQVITMLIVDILIIVLLVWILNRSITSPITNLSQQIYDMSLSTNNLNALQTKATLAIHREDELGTISKTFNSFVSHISDLFNELQKSNKVNEEYLKAVYAGSIVSKADIQGNITYVNQALCDVTGYAQDELIGQPHSIFRHPDTPKSTFREMWRSIEKGRIWHGLFKNSRKDGSTFYANITVVPILNDSGVITEYLALRDDVTELVQSQKKLRKAFSTDKLTNLGNRFKLLNDYVNLEQAFLAIIDIRSFKEINDFYGYEIGDKVIIELSNHLFNYFDQEGYEIYRLQGDEFAVLANGNLTSEDDYIKSVQNLSESIYNNPLRIADYQPGIDLTIGISTNRLDLFTEADIAHKTAKKRNKTLVIYSDQLQTSEEYKNNLLWTGRVKEALNEGRIVTYYQPIVNNHTGTISKYEALVRMSGENNEITSPFHFLEIAKKARLYPRLTKTMIENSFKQFEHRSEQFSINLTADDMINDEIIHYLLEMISQYKIGQQLVLEIVESENIENFDEVESFINIAKAEGCKIAVDDFGTGYSNFEFLLKLKPDFIKIDGSMVREINTNSDVFNIVETIIDFAKKNNIQTIAEFVSDEAIYDTIKEMGVDFSQGYYFSEPKPGDGI